jgi:uncharacterized protein (TIGR02444 family)
MPNRLQKFWGFSIELYRQPGVAQACLQLQDCCDMDVNLLLYCYWYGVSFGRFDPALLQEVYEFSCNWKQGMVQPLRSVRQWMKTQTQLVSENQQQNFLKLRDRIKSDELGAEKIQQEMLEMISLRAIPADTDTGSTAIEANLVQLLQACNIPVTNDIQSKLNVILQALETSSATRSWTDPLSPS